MSYLNKIIITLFVTCIASMAIEAQILDKSWSKIVKMDEGTWFAST